MTITQKEYEDLKPEFGERLDTVIVDARTALETLLRPLNIVEKTARLQLLVRRPTFYEEAMPMMEKVYEPLRDMTLESDGFPPWSQLSVEQKKVAAFRASRDPQAIQQAALRAGLLMAHELRGRAKDLLD